MLIIQLILRKAVLQFFKEKQNVIFTDLSKITRKINLYNGNNYKKKVYKNKKGVIRKKNDTSLSKKMPENLFSLMFNKTCVTL